MTVHVRAELHGLLLRKFFSKVAQRIAPPRASSVDAGAVEMPAMHFRSEGFAEDLSESHPLN